MHIGKRKPNKKTLTFINLNRKISLGFSRVSLNASFKGLQLKSSKLEQKKKKKILKASKHELKLFILIVHINIFYEFYRVISILKETIFRENLEIESLVYKTNI